MTKKEKRKEKSHTSWGAYCSCLTLQVLAPLYWLCKLYHIVENLPPRSLNSGGLQSVPDALSQLFAFLFFSLLYSLSLSSLCFSLLLLVVWVGRLDFFSIDDGSDVAQRRIDTVAGWVHRWDLPTSRSTWIFVMMIDDDHYDSDNTLSCLFFFFCSFLLIFSCFFWWGKSSSYVTINLSVILEFNSWEDSTALASLVSSRASW